MILIYSKDVDDFVNDVIDYLQTDFIRICESNNSKIIAMDFNNSQSSYLYSNNYSDAIDIDKLRSVWFNGGCIKSGNDNYEDKCYEVLNDAYLLIASCKKIGRRIADFEGNRLDIMLEAKNQNFKIPHTLITGSKSKLKSFFNLYKLKNGIISKRILDEHYYYDEKFAYNFNLTFKITEDIFDKITDEFAISFFQERIIADFEIRVVLIDEILYSTAIHIFDDTIDCRTKFRNLNDLRLVPFKLPKDIENQLLNIFKKFNLTYGSADLLFVDNEYYFLEINPAGQISFVNNACNYYIEKQLATILENGI